MTPELHRPWFSHYEPSVPRTVIVFDQPLYSLLDEAAARYPKRPALIFQNTRMRPRNVLPVPCAVRASSRASAWPSCCPTCPRP